MTQLTVLKLPSAVLGKQGVYCIRKYNSEGVGDLSQCLRENCVIYVKDGMRKFMSLVCVSLTVLFQFYFSG
jgi:hypothetical protein